jgi:putative endonuclease
MRPGPGQLWPRAGRRHVARADLGRRAEVAVADYLFASGFWILARNLRLGPLELDIVARKGTLLVVTEVRTRGPGALVGAFESVTPTKRARLARAVERMWRDQSVSIADVLRVRIDVAAVTFQGTTTRIEYAAGALGR